MKKTKIEEMKVLGKKDEETNEKDQNWRNESIREKRWRKDEKQRSDEETRRSSNHDKNIRREAKGEEMKHREERMKNKGMNCDWETNRRTTKGQEQETMRIQWAVPLCLN